jgi:hypothetical protein
MTNCNEYFLDDLMAITAIPVSDIPASEADSPVNSITPTISANNFYPTLANAIVIGLQPATDNGALIPITRKSGKAKDDESDSVAGRLHTVTVTCEADDRNIETDDTGRIVYDHLLALERTPHHLLLSFRGGKQAFVAATEDTYLCNVERDGAKVSVAFKIQCLMGIQIIV